MSNIWQELLVPVVIGANSPIALIVEADDHKQQIEIMLMCSWALSTAAVQAAGAAFRKRMFTRSDSHWLGLVDRRNHPALIRYLTVVLIRCMIMGT